MGKSLTISRVSSFRGKVRPPSDKSLTHRAYLLAALAQPVPGEEFVPAVDGPGAASAYGVPGRNVSQILNPLTGEDCESTLGCLEALGVRVERVSDRERRVQAAGHLSGKDVILDCGNSGTTMRLLAGLVAASPDASGTMVGDASLSKRPMKRVVQPLRLMGAEIEGDTAPLTFTGKTLSGISYESPVASAQIKSCLLLAGLLSDGTTTVTEPSLSRDHTERMLTALGVDLQRDGLAVSVRGGQSWNSFAFRVPADISSAAFFMVAAALQPSSRVTLQEVGVNPSRTGILDVFAQAGISITIDPRQDELGEPVADLSIESPETLKPFAIQGDLVPRLIDEIPVLAVLATQCHGTSIIRDAAEMRVKETDRIAVVADALTQMGAQVEVFPDGMAITGPTALKGITVDSAGDHRIGMSFAIAGSIAEGQTTILNADHIGTSYPEFEQHFETLAVRS